MYSILGQSFTDFEFIIYDDGSDRELAGYLHRFGEMDDRVVLISNPENHGVRFRQIKFLCPFHAFPSHPSPALRILHHA